MAVKDRFFIYTIKEGEGFHFRIKHSELLYIRAKGDYVFIKTKNTGYTVHKTLKQITEELSEVLYRNHRSYSVNIQHIEFLDKTDLYIGEEKIPIGEEYRKELLNILYNKQNETIGV